MSNKTIPTTASVTDYLTTIDDPHKHADMQVLVQLMQDVTGHEAIMWGDSIIGFGHYEYRYISGRQGEFFILGVSARKQNLTLYIMPGYQDYAAYLSQLGQHKTGKCCLYIKRLDDIDLDVLESLLERGWQDMLARNISNPQFITAINHETC